MPFAVLTGHQIAYVPSGTTLNLLRQSKPTRGTKVLALGDPDYTAKSDRHQLAILGHSGLTPLPASAQEAKAIGDAVLLQREATVARLKSALDSGTRWRALHLACHGLMNPERPDLSALALSGSFLRCLDVYRMKVPADLVVLSACETGKGKIFRAEGVIGFTNAFLYAGAPRVIVSLWRVDDKATAALMKKFYELWKDGKMSAAAALKRAQAHVRSHEEWKHPYFWAAWQLWGLGE